MMRKYSPKIKEIREALGYRQLELSRLTNISQSQISKWERGKSYPDFNELKALSLALQCKIEDLYDR